MKAVHIALLMIACLIPGAVHAQDVSNFDDTVHFMVIALVVAPFAYFLPSIVAASIGHPRSNAIFLVNLLGGWSGVGWIAAFVWTFIPARRQGI